MGLKVGLSVTQGEGRGEAHTSKPRPAASKMAAGSVEWQTTASDKKMR